MKNMFSGDMIKQVKQMRDQIKKAQKELEKETVIGSASGLVEVQMTGSQKCKSIHIDAEELPSLSADRLEALFLHAANDALDKSRKLMANKLGPLSGGLGGLGF